ncbi:EAL domain-containing protein [Desulfococcus sp.]|uniref:EAL domain-containing protein n=1 Tax=Desulfococcus sp. TaxID=2025834 RepID=UPI0035934739
MPHLTAADWHRVLDTLDYAFQPIVNIHTGAIYGVEALIRRWDDAGFTSIPLFFDTVFQDRDPHEVNRGLFDIAFAKFQQMPWAGHIRLFYNLDSRLFHAETFLPDELFAAFKDARLPRGSVCLEITERHQVCTADNLPMKMKGLRTIGCGIAVDDFGAGFSGTQLLYYTQPEYVKIDRFYIQNIEKDTRKRMLAASMVRLAHLMGSLVVAEGVETELEYHCCKNIGCDLLQGYLVQRPTLEIGDIRQKYDAIDTLRLSDRRAGSRGDMPMVEAEIEAVEAAGSHTEPARLMDMARANPRRAFVPVVGESLEPLGIVRAAAVEAASLSESGRGVAPQARRSGPTVADLITRIPVVDIHTPIDEIIDRFAAQGNSEGVLITRSMKYVGFLSAHAILRILTEKKPTLDQNPLTGLPGSRMVYEYLSRTLNGRGDPRVLVRFDFDRLKLYNDTYGFRQGDRIILLFSELLKQHAPGADLFAGHLGGDDFFMGAGGRPLEAVVEDIRKVRERFRSDAESFYDPDTIARGCLETRRRNGGLERVPLLTVSAAALELALPTPHFHTPETVGAVMAAMMKEAKRLPEGIRAGRLDTRGTDALRRPFKKARSTLTAA